MQSSQAAPATCKTAAGDPAQRPARTRPRAIQLGRLLGCLLLSSMLWLPDGVCGVVVRQVRLSAGRSARPDYALAGESLELSCAHMMKDEAEDIKQLVWSKDGKNFLRWRKNKPGLEVLSYTFKGHIEPNSTHSRLMIRNATIDMHGKLKCTVRTDLSTHAAELELVVISAGQCRGPSNGQWRVLSDQQKCRELLRFECRQMFPKPVHSCGLWDAKGRRFIQSVALDISEEPVAGGGGGGNSSPMSSSNGTQTYRVRYADKFDLLLPNGSPNPLSKDLLPFAGHLIFKCDIVIPETSWRLAFAHKMFDFSDGCNQDPLETIGQMRANFSQYAKLRIQQLYRKTKHQLEDIEMLAANLKYEILPPPPPQVIDGDSKASANAIANASNTSMDPKYQLVVGSLAHDRTGRKWAQSTAAAATASGSANVNCWQRPRLGARARLSCAGQSGDKGALRLTGTNLLECRPGGWAPIRPTGELLAARERKPAPARLRAARELLNLSQTTPTANSDGDILSGDSLNANAAAAAAAAAAADDDDRSSRRDHTDEPDNQIDSAAESTPAELAALLPSCVLVSSNAAARRRQHDRPPPSEPSAGSDADAAGTARESRAKHAHAHERDGLEPATSWLGWFTFVSSSAPPSLRANLRAGSQFGPLALGGALALVASARLLATSL